jgi:hypothetical protein
MLAVRRHPIITATLLALTGGILGFVGGAAWCLHDFPGSPQAPLFGLFITGPLGSTLGLVVAVILIIRAHRAASPTENDNP